MTDWHVAWKHDGRPAHEKMASERFWALVGPDAGWERGPGATIARQRWRWSVLLLGKRGPVQGRYRVEAEGHAPTRAKAKACAEAIIRALEAPGRPLPR